MCESKQYICVNCGEVASALYRTYGPTVLKLTNCGKCKGVVDKYIEYDPVIVMIDLVLISKEAQRHVLYNTDFKAFWKLFIILMLLETYGVWKNDSLFNIAVNSLCGIDMPSTNHTYLKLPVNISTLPRWEMQCRAWQPDLKSDSDVQKNFYIQFLSTFSGIAVFILAMDTTLNSISSYFLCNKVPFLLMLKAFSLSNVSLLLTLPTLVWAPADTALQTAALHYALAFAYGVGVFASVFTVVYKCPVVITVLVLLASNYCKYITMFHMTPYITGFVT